MSTAETPLQVGPFEVSRILGTGGMGDVWLGRHVEEDYPVAVKILRPKTAKNQQYLAYFRNEVRAVAGLSHPNIIAVYDYGKVEAATARQSDGKLLQGSPWLAMELANHGSLIDWRGKLDWSVLRGIMISLLDALAHAHARGVLHRDLKGANVLVSGPERVVKLADFGLANPMFNEAAETDVGKNIAGTPWYMAPEQFSGVRQDQGPWTDLYAFGCLAWALLTGTPPFPERGWRQARIAHLTREPPAFKVRVNAPKGIEAWLRTLLQKSVHDRFCTAADAAWALLQLGDAPPGARPLPSLDGAELHPPSATTGAQSFGFHTDHAPDIIESTLVFPRPKATVEWSLPPFPTDWRQQESTKSNKAPPGVGLGLYGLRSIPMVGRTEERELLWNELRRVRARQRPSAVILQGPAGSGKSRLAQWIVERASEAGAATPFKAVHGPSAGPMDGISASLLRYYRCVGLTRKMVRKHVALELTDTGVEDVTEIQAVVSLVAPPAPGESGVRFESAQERWAVLQHFFERRCAERPVVLWIDDAQRGLDALAFTSFLLDLPRNSQLPILIVLTVREEEIAQRQMTENALAELAAHPSSTMVPIGAFKPQEAQKLVSQLLRLEASLARSIQARTGGNPLFAVQLVGDLVSRGVLVQGTRGFHLTTGARLELPSNLEQVWRKRVLTLLEHRSDADRNALYLAAILGQDVDPLEWHAVCTRAKLPVPDDLVDTLLVQRLATADEAGAEWGWSFVHGMLRETIESMARDEDEDAWRKQHRTVAAFLADQGEKGMSLRLGRHLLSAGEAKQALGPLLEAAASPELDARVAESLLIDRERAAESLNLPHDDERVVEGWLLRARILIRQGREQAAARWASRALAAAEEVGRDKHTAAAYHILAEVARLKHRFGQSIQMRRKAVMHAMRGMVPDIQADAMAGIGRLYLDVGNWSQASNAYKEALRTAQLHDLNATAADCLTSLGYIAVKSGRISESDEYFEEAAEYVSRSGSRVQQAHLQNALADLARKRGDFSVAEEHSREAMRYYLSTGTRAARVMMLNLSLFQVLQGKFSGARATIESVMSEDLGGEEGRAFSAGCLAVLLPCLADAQEWANWYRHLETIERTFSGDLFVDDDTLAMLEMGAQLAEQSGDKVRARAAWTLARKLWIAVGNEEAATRIDELMG